MRVKYYITTLRQMKFNKSFVLFLLIVILVFTILFNIYYRSLKPTIKSLTEDQVKILALKTSNNAVKNVVKGIKYNDLMTLEKDNNGKITSLSANVEKMNEISSDVVLSIQEEFEKYNENYIRLPVSSFTGMSILSGHGIRLKIKTLPLGISSAKFISTFDKSGINQTRHKITLEISTKIETIAPLFTDTYEYKNEIVIAETVIMGDIPSSYYDIQGISDIKLKDTLDMVEN